MRGKWKTKTTTQSASDLSPIHQTSECVSENIRHQKSIWEHHIWCHVNISEVATLVSLSMVPSFWCSLDVAAAKLHICFVIKANLWWKGTFFQMATTVVLHHKYSIWSYSRHLHSTPHVIAWPWSIRKDS